MVWWIVGGIVVLALVGLVVVLVVVAVHLRQFAGVAMTVNTASPTLSGASSRAFSSCRRRPRCSRRTMLAAEEKAAEPVERSAANRITVKSLGGLNRANLAEPG